ncbi:MAG: hypothetical protein ABIJ61_06955, partial [bacterium]
RIHDDSPERFQKIETADVARMVGEVADAPIQLQVPEIVLYPRSTEIGKRERTRFPSVQITLAFADQRRHYLPNYSIIARFVQLNIDRMAI